MAMAGTDRARPRPGFYSHDRLERLVGADIRNADEIHPEWQHLAVGDLVRTYGPIPRFEPLGWIVAAIDPPCLLVVHEPKRSDIINSSWAFVLERDGRRTRLLSRWRFRRRGVAHTVFKWLAFDPAHFIMETGVLRGLKMRVERQAPTTPRRDTLAMAQFHLDTNFASTRARAGVEGSAHGSDRRCAMRVCIVGASGKLGQYMIRHALDNGYAVVCFGNTASTPPEMTSDVTGVTEGFRAFI
jgi:hypothetical protein